MRPPRAPIARVRVFTLILSAGTPLTMMPTISSKLPVVSCTHALPSRAGALAAPTPPLPWQFWQLPLLKIDANGEADYQVIAKVLATAQNAGLSSISFKR